MMLDGAPGDARGPGDVVDGRGGVADVHEQPVRGVQDPLARGCRLG